MAFGKVRHSQILSQAGNTWDVEIYKNGFSGTSLEFNMQGEGFEITWNGQGDTLDTQFLASELTLNYYVENQTDEDFMYNDIFLFSENKHYIRVYKTEQDSTKKIWWYGWLTPSFDTVENNSFPYVIQLNATDSYGFYKSRDKDGFVNYEDKTSYKKITQILGFESPYSGNTDNRGFLGRMNLVPSASAFNERPCPFYVNGGSSGTKSAIIKNQIQWWRKNANSSIYDYTIKWLPNAGTSNQSWFDPFFNYYFSKSIFSEADAFDENDEVILPTGSALEYKESDIFDTVLKCFSATGFLSEGSYLFRQPLNFRTDPTATIPTFSYENQQQLQAAIATRPPAFNSSDLLTINQSTNVILGGSVLTFEPSFKTVTINFDEGFSIANVIQGTSLDTRVQIGTITNEDLGPIALSFSAIATEVITEPNAVGESSPAYTVSGAVISAGGIRTNSLLKISLLLPSGNRRYLKQTSGSSQLTWGNENSSGTGSDVHILNIVRGNDVFNITDEPINNTGFMARDLNVVPFSGVQRSGDMLKSKLTTPTQRTTKTLIEFDCTIATPPSSGQLELEMSSRNSTGSGFSGYYMQCKHFAPQSRSYEVFTAPNIPNSNLSPPFVSNKTEVNNIQFNYTRLSEGESITSVVTYKANQDVVPSSKTNNLGTSLLGQTPVNPLSSIGFRTATASSSGGSQSIYPIMNETDEFVIKPVITGFVRGNPSSPNPINLLELLTKEKLSLQSKPLEILQADIFSPIISPSKLIKYSINDNLSFKYYVFKGGTFKAQSDTMSGEWFMVKQADLTINTTRFPEFSNGNFIIDFEERLAQLTTRVAQQNDLIESITQSNSFATLSASRTTKTTYTDLAVTAIPQALLSTQSLKLTMPDGSSPVFLTITSNVSAGVTLLPVSGGFILDETYPVGSLISLNQSVTAPTP